MTASPTARPFDRVPPPLLFLGTFFVGFVVQRGVWPNAGPALPPWAHAVAAGIGLAGLLTLLSAFVLFGRNGTTIMPHGQPAALVLQGAYRFTRNPMYVSLTLVYVGVAIWTRTWVALILCPVPLILINRLVIPMEEARLLSRFGDAYVTYKARVRRWI